MKSPCWCCIRLVGDCVIFYFRVSSFHFIISYNRALSFLFTTSWSYSLARGGGWVGDRLEVVLVSRDQGGDIGDSLGEGQDGGG